MTFLLGVGTAAIGPALQAVLPGTGPAEGHGPGHQPEQRGAERRPRRRAGHVHPGHPFRSTAPTGVGAVVPVVGAVVRRGGLGAVAWKRPPQRAAVHGEEMWGAIRAGFQYTIHSPANRAILLRVLAFIVPAVVMWSQVPIIATRLLNMGEEAVTPCCSRSSESARSSACCSCPGCTPATRSTRSSTSAPCCSPSDWSLLSFVHSPLAGRGHHDVPGRELGHHPHQFQHRHAEIRAAVGEGAGDLVLPDGAVRLLRHRRRIWGQGDAPVGQPRASAPHS